MECIARRWHDCPPMSRLSSHCATRDVAWSAQKVQQGADTAELIRVKKQTLTDKMALQEAEFKKTESELQGETDRIKNDVSSPPVRLKQRASNLR